MAELANHIIQKGLVDVLALQLAEGDAGTTAEVEVEGLGTITLPQSMQKIGTLVPVSWPGPAIQDPNHLSRVFNDAHGAGIYSHGGQVRTQGILDVDSTNSRFLASALDFRNAVCRRAIPGYSTASQELGNMQTDLLLGLVEQNRTMRRIHEALEHAGVYGVLHEIKIDGSSWCVPGQGGPDNYKAWVGGDYRTNVESSVRIINSLIMGWNMLKAAEDIVLTHLPSEPVEHDS